MEYWNEKLHTAAGNGDIEALKLCLENDADIDYHTDDGFTGLMFAAMYGHIEVCRLILYNGCKIDTTNVNGYTALMLAARRGHLEFDGRTALHLAAQYGDLQVTRYLVEQAGISPLIKTHQGDTPYDLAAAASLGESKKVMKYLQTVMSEKSSGVTAGQQIEDSVKSAMLKRLLGSGSYESFDLRCMVTGQFSVGKSSLVKLLVGDVIPEGSHPTDGISLIEGRCGLDIENRNWIMIDPATYNALDVVYNKVLMTSVEEEKTNTPQKHELYAKPVDSPNVENTYSQKSESTTFPVNLSSEPSTQQQATQSLSPQTFPGESKTHQMKKKVTTKITRKEIRKRMEKVLKKGKYMMKVGRLIFWDFGGQYVYYTTHQTFMTFRALFLVVFDGSKGLHEEIRDVLCFPGQHMTPTPAVFLLHWVNSILTYCKVVYSGIPKILFVATHKDKVPVDDLETRRAQVYSEIEELFKNHEGRNHLIFDKQIFVNATDKNDQEIETLRKTITDLTFDHPCWGEKMPNACVPLELEIAELVAAGKQILSLVELEEMNAISMVSVLDLDQLHDFLNFQHSMGKIVYFDTLQLRDYVIINPLLMVEVMRSFVTDIGFWPKNRRMQLIFRRMSESGIIRREDLYQIWEQKNFRPILPYKQFIFDLLIHLDILSENRRYDTATGSRLPVENFFVSCMVTERNTTSFMANECTPERSVCLAFVFKGTGTVIPPALPNRLISACLSMWTLKQYEGRKLLFSGFIVVSFDKVHDIVVCVEGNKILLYIVHKTSSGLIIPDVATGVKECLVTTMERISDFYQSTIHVKHGQQLPFHIEYSCSRLKCFITEEKAVQTNEWVCDKHKQTHRLGTFAVWNQDKETEQCEQNCQGLQDDALNQIPSDVELQRFSSGCDESTIQKLAIHLGMTLKEWEKLVTDYRWIDIVKYRMLVSWREKYSGRFNNLAKALTDMDVSTHTLCQVKRIRKAEYDISEEYMDLIPTDEILDELAQVLGVVSFQLGIELELPITSLDIIQYNNERNLVAQCKDILYQWREQGVRPTIAVLVNALVNVGRGTKCLEEIIKSKGVKKYALPEDIEEEKKGNLKTLVKKLNPFQKKYTF